MIDLRAAVTWVPGIGSGARDVRSGLLRLVLQPAIGGRGTALRSIPLDRTAGGGAPWSWTDLARMLFWTTALVAGGLLAYLLARVLAALFFAFAEASGHVHPGTYDTISATLGPYSATIGWMFAGCLTLAALSLSIYRTAIRKHGLGWSALYFRRAGRREYLRTVALFIPLVLAGAVLVHVQSLVLGGSGGNPEGVLLTYGVPTVAGNVVLLFLLVAVVVPLIEEILFRAFLFRLLCNTMPPWAAALGSATAGAAAHGIPALMPWLIFTGMAYAMVVQRTRSIYCGMLLHGLVNAVAAVSMIAVWLRW